MEWSGRAMGYGFRIVIYHIIVMRHNNLLHYELWI
jgi:hypothetical protein